MITNQVTGDSDRFEFSTVQFEGREKVLCETVGRVSADAEDGYGEIESESTYPPMPALKFTDGRRGSIRCICLKLVRRMALLIQNRHYSKRIRHKTDKTAFLGHSPRNYIVNITYASRGRARIETFYVSVLSVLCTKYIKNLNTDSQSMFMMRQIQDR
jgi:hypothetical protein